MLAWRVLQGVFAVAFVAAYVWPGGPPGAAGHHTEGHIAAYTVLALLLWPDLRSLRVGHRVALVSIFGMWVGLAMEMVQLAVPGRSGQFSDLQPDALGLAVALVALLGLRRWVDLAVVRRHL
ncbi:MAG: VanZ family protein [Thermoplasmatota archaeon]